MGHRQVALQVSLAETTAVAVAVAVAMALQVAMLQVENHPHRMVLPVAAQVAVVAVLVPLPLVPMVCFITTDQVEAVEDFLVLPEKLAGVILDPLANVVAPQEQEVFLPLAENQAH